MFTLQAPYPSLQTTTYLPNPQFGDSEASCDTVTLKRSMNGVRRTYVKKRGRRKHMWQFQLSRNKSLELEEFFKSYHASMVRITDHRGDVWIGNFTSNPFDFEISARAEPAIAPMPRGEFVNIGIEFEGVKQ